MQLFKSLNYCFLIERINRETAFIFLTVLIKFGQSQLVVSCVLDKKLEYPWWFHLQNETRNLFIRAYAQKHEDTVILEQSSFTENRARNKKHVTAIPMKPFFSNFSQYFNYGNWYFFRNWFPKDWGNLHLAIFVRF